MLLLLNLLSRLPTFQPGQLTSCDVEPPLDLSKLVKDLQPIATPAYFPWNHTR